MRTIDPSTAVTPAKMAHFVLRCSNLEASIAWYEAVLGMQVVHASDKMPLAFLTYDDEHHRMALVQAPVAETAPEGSAGLDHVAYTLDSLEQLLSLYRRLAAQGIKPVWPVNHGLTTSLYYADPDGNRVEFQVENLATKEELQAYMHSPAFAANPIGETYDPEDLCRRWEAGEDLASLARIGFD